MKGYESGGGEEGLIPLSIREIYDVIKQEISREFEVRVSYIEIYNESVNDLIEPQNKNE